MVDCAAAGAAIRQAVATQRSCFSMRLSGCDISAGYVLGQECGLESSFPEGFTTECAEVREGTQRGRHRNEGAPSRETPCGLCKPWVRTYPASAAAPSVTGSSGASHSLPHLRHFRKFPRALVNFISAPTYAHSGQVSVTGLFQITKSQFSFEQA